VKTDGTPLPDEPPLAAALRACADGLYRRKPLRSSLSSTHPGSVGDFRNGFVDVGTSITDGTTLIGSACE
jgi:hypothetical protein